MNSLERSIRYSAEPARQWPRPTTGLRPIFAEHIAWLGSLYRLLGSEVTVLLLASLPVGIVLGGIEIVTASALYAVLIEFQLVAGAAGMGRLFGGISATAVLLLLTVVAGGLRYGAQLLPARANQALTARLREALVRNTLGGVTERKALSVADVSNLLSTLIPKSAEFVHSIIMSALGAGLLLLILGGMLHLSWQLTAVMLIFTVLLGVVLWLLRQAYGRYSERIYATLSEFNLTFLRDVRNSHLLRVCGVNEIEEDRLVGISRENVGYLRRYYLLFAASSNIPLVAPAFLMVAVFWLNSKLGFLALDGLVPLAYLLLRTGGSVAGVAAAGGMARQAKPHIVALMRYVGDLFPEANGPAIGREMPTSLFPLVIENLRFGRTAPLCPPVSLSAGSGDTVVISGPSGRGKTTLLMTLIGFLSSLGGTITWGGMPIERIDPSRLRLHFGYAGPEPYLIDADIRTNLVFGLERNDVSDAAIKEAIDLACAGFVFELDGGLWHCLRDGGEGISAGQKQRLAIARCLLRRPKVLLLDEATANIDEDTERRIMEKVRAALPDLLIIAVSHRASMRSHATAMLGL